MQDEFACTSVVQELVEILDRLAHRGRELRQKKYESDLNSRTINQIEMVIDDIPVEEDDLRTVPPP